MSTKIIFILINVFFLNCSTKNKLVNNNCEIFNSGKFISPEMGNETNTITIKNNLHIETDFTGKFRTKSEIKMIGDCKFELKIIETNYSDRPFKVGDKMLIQIDSVKNNYIYFTANFKDKSIKDILLKVSN